MRFWGEETSAVPRSICDIDRNISSSCSCFYKVCEAWLLPTPAPSWTQVEKDVASSVTSLGREELSILSFLVT